jgi:nitrite reductase/ring-hydroxylating ferredoxin subunit
MEDSMENPLAAVRWLSVMDDASLPEAGLKSAYPLGINIVVARVDGIVYALSGTCPHLGCPLSTGRLAGAILTCACHDWRFDVRTGAFLSAPEIRLTTFPVRSENGTLLIGLDAKETTR